MSSMKASPKAYKNCLHFIYFSFAKEFFSTTHLFKPHEKHFSNSFLHPALTEHVCLGTKCDIPFNVPMTTFPYPLAHKRMKKKDLQRKLFSLLSSQNFHDRLVSTWTLTRLNRTLCASILKEFLAVLSTTTLCCSTQGWNHAKRVHKLFLAWSSVNQKLRQCQKPSTIPVNAEHDFKLVLLLKTSCD